MKDHLATIFSAGTCLSLLAINFGMRWLNLDDPPLGSSLLVFVGLAGLYSLPFLWFISLVLVIKFMVKKRAVPYLATVLFLVATGVTLYGLVMQEI